MKKKKRGKIGLGKKGENKKKKKEKIEEFKNLSPLPFNLAAFWLFCFCIVLSKKKKKNGEEREERMDTLALLQKNPSLKRIAYFMEKEVKVQITFWTIEYIKFIPVW